MALAAGAVHLFVIIQLVHYDDILKDANRLWYPNLNIKRYG